jgi:hypothetical protein
MKRFGTTGEGFLIDRFLPTVRFHEEIMKAMLLRKLSYVLICNL